MRKLVVRSLAVAVVASGLQAAPAAAAAYLFIPNWTNPPGLPVHVQIDFADGAGQVQGTRSSGNFSGIDSFLFRVGTYEADLTDLLSLKALCIDENPATCQSSFLLNYDLSPEKGSIQFNDTARDFKFEYDAGLGEGYHNNDPGAGTAECNLTGTCRFTGLWTQVSEPTMAFLLVSGLAIAGFARRRP